MRQQPGPFTRGRRPRLPALRHRIRRVRIPHRPKREQPGDRRQSMVDRRRRVAVQRLPRHRHHVPRRAAGHLRLPARTQKVQQHNGCHRIQAHALLHQPAAQRQQVEPVRAHRPRRIVPIRQIPQVVVHQPEPCRVRTGQPPHPPSARSRRNVFSVTATDVAHLTPYTQAPSRLRCVATRSTTTQSTIRIRLAG